jgi:hypothetical protein
VSCPDFIAAWMSLIVASKTQKPVGLFAAPGASGAPREADDAINAASLDALIMNALLETRVF